MIRFGLNTFAKNTIWEMLLFSHHHLRRHVMSAFPLLVMLCLIPCLRLSARPTDYKGTFFSLCKKQSVGWYFGTMWSYFLKAFVLLSGLSTHWWFFPESVINIGDCKMVWSHSEATVFSLSYRGAEEASSSPLSRGEVASSSWVLLTWLTWQL